ncbi:MAG: lipid-A-disaccharide synthase-like uncharacterized protein [Verrucomicrobiales bacterium]|jgi:lipid-A-disaccharide synthase-like uncharacterized protein
MKLTRRRKRLILGVSIALLAPLGVWIGLVAAGVAPKPGEAMFPPFNMSDRVWKLPIEGEPGDLKIVYDKGSYTPEEFFDLVRERQVSARGVAWLFSVLDITSWVSLGWVAFGLLGQGIFAGRMVVQLIAAERAKKSVVPPIFWWMSLVGSTMLIIYFIWRVEVVGILGQATGWIVYIRNLWFIYGRPRESAG